MAREQWLSCQECPTRASGIWLVVLDDEPKAFVRLCAQCGLYAYVHKRETFSPGLRLSLIRTFRTSFLQSQLPHDPVPVKHWAERTSVPEHRLPSGKTITQILKATSIKRHGPSTVHPSLLNFHRD